MLVYVRQAWAWTATGAGLATALFAGYLGVRAVFGAPNPPAGELFLVVTVK
jgi:hypothetical protein